MSINVNKIKQFLSKDNIQEALSRDDIEYVYAKFAYESNSFTNILTDYLLSIGVNVIDYVDKVLTRDKYECSKVEKITIPSRIKVIGINAFADCDRLEEVIIEDGVTDISANAFSDCRVLSKVVVPDSVKVIGSSAFDGCYEVKIYCNENSYIHSYCEEWGIDYVLNNKRINESLTEEQETLIEDVQDNAHEQQRIIDDIRKLLTEQEFEEEEKLNGIAFTQEVNKPVELIAQFYVDTTDLSHSSYIKSDDKSFSSNYSNKGEKDSLQKAAALFVKEFIEVTTADII